MEASEIGIEAHFAAEGIKFNDEVGLGESADGGVAGHQAEGVALGGDEEGFAAHPGGGEGGFASGMACANDEDIVGSRGSGGHSSGIIPRWGTARRFSNHKEAQRYAKKHKGRQPNGTHKERREENKTRKGEVERFHGGVGEGGLGVMVRGCR